jgi:hypothetical protein
MIRNLEEFSMKIFHGIRDEALSLIGQRDIKALPLKDKRGKDLVSLPHGQGVKLLSRDPAKSPLRAGWKESSRKTGTQKDKIHPLPSERGIPRLGKMEETQEFQRPGCKSRLFKELSAGAVGNRFVGLPLPARGDPEALMHIILFFISVQHKIMPPFSDIDENSDVCLHNPFPF